MPGWFASVFLRSFRGLFCVPQFFGSKQRSHLTLIFRISEVLLLLFLQGFFGAFFFEGVVAGLLV